MVGAWVGQCGLLRVRGRAVQTSTLLAVVVTLCDSADPTLRSFAWLLCVAALIEVLSCCCVILAVAAETCDPAQIKKTLDAFGGNQKKKCSALAATAGKYVACMDDEAVKDKKTCKVPTDEQRCACYSTITEPEAEKFNCKWVDTPQIVAWCRTAERGWRARGVARW